MGRVTTNTMQGGDKPAASYGDWTPIKAVDNHYLSFKEQQDLIREALTRTGTRKKPPTYSKYIVQGGQAVLNPKYQQPGAAQPLPVQPAPVQPAPALPPDPLTRPYR